MSLVVTLGSKAEDNQGGGFYPQAYHEYKATITDITAEKFGDYDVISVKTLVESDTGATYEETKNGPAIFQGEYFDANISRLINVALNSPENEGTLDTSIAQTTSPDLSKLIGCHIGVRYSPQKKAPEFATSDGLITTDQVRGCIDQVKYDKWVATRKANKDKKATGGGTSTTTKTTEKSNPFQRK